MSFPWSYKNLPELRNLSDSERLRVWRAAIALAPRWVRVTSGLLTGLIPGLAIWVCATLLNKGLFLMFLIGCVGGFIGVAVGEELLLPFRAPDGENGTSLIYQSG